MAFPIGRTVRVGLAAAAFLVAVSLVLEFQMRAKPTRMDAPAPRVAVVFTGQFDRIRFGLDQFEAGALDLLFISGVNAGAGLFPERFDAQFELPVQLRQARRDGQIILAEEARTTLENAVETACWGAQLEGLEALQLITGQTHMPRASVALERALPAEVSVMRVVSGVEQEARALGLWGREFPKFLATWAVTWMPRAVWGGESPVRCEDAP